MEFAKNTRVAHIAHSIGMSAEQLEKAARDLLRGKLVQIGSPITPNGDYVGYYAKVSDVQLRNGTCYVDLVDVRREIDGKPVAEKSRKDRREPYPVMLLKFTELP